MFISKYYNTIYMLRINLEVMSGNKEEHVVNLQTD